MPCQLKIKKILDVIAEPLNAFTVRSPAGMRLTLLSKGSSRLSPGALRGISAFRRGRNAASSLVQGWRQTCLAPA